MWKWVQMLGYLRILILVGFAVMSQSAGAQPSGGPGKGTSKVVAISGELEVIVEDDLARGRSSLHYFVVGASGSRTPLRFGTPPGPLRSGQQVAVQGLAGGEGLEVTDLQLATSAGSQGASSGSGGSAISPLLATNEQRPAVVLMVDLLDARASDRYTLGQLSDAMFTGARSVDALYREASHFQTSIPGDADADGWADVFGPFTVNYTASCYGYNDWAAAADAAATAAGVDLSLYRHRVYVVPHYSDLGCSWAGLGGLGCGATCRVWIADGGSPTLFAHELGHNYGMNHASTDWNNDGVVDSEYGDYSDPVGQFGQWRIFNAPHMDQMGWFNGFPNALAEAATGGIYTLHPLSVNPAASPGLQVLKVAKPDTNEFYYLSYRQPIGYDSDLSPFYTSGASLHHYANGRRTHFIDTLEDGFRFVDSVNGVEFTQLGVSPDGSEVRVEVALACADPSPSLDVLPAEQSVAPGGAASYAVEVTNHDFPGCPAAAFVLAASLPSEISGTLSPSQVTLAPGEVGTVSLQVSAGAVGGRHEFEVAAVAYPAGVPGIGALVVDATAPTATTLRARVKRKTRVLLDWTAASDGGGSGISHYLLHRDVGTGGGLDVVVSGLSYTDTDTASGNIYTYTVYAVDVAGNQSAASNSVEINLGGGDGDGGGGGGGKGKGRNK